MARSAYLVEHGGSCAGFIAILRTARIQNAGVSTMLRACWGVPTCVSKGRETRRTEKLRDS